MATILRPDGTSEQRDHITFEECRRIVAGENQKDGGHVVPIYLEDHVMLVNEDGNPLGLPPNKNATLFAHQPIVGDVVMLDLVEASKVLDQGSC